MQCAICQQSVDDGDRVQAKLQSAEMERDGECQTLFFHKACLREAVASNVPLHPDIGE